MVSTALAGDLASAQDLYQRGEFAALIARFSQAGNGDAALQALCAQSHWRLGHAEAAGAAFAQAAFIYARQGAADASRCTVNAINAFKTAGRARDAIAIVLDSLQFPRACDLHEVTLQHAFKAALDARVGDLLVAVACAGSQFASTREVALRTLLDIAHQPARYGVELSSTRLGEGVTPPSVSLVVCSIDDSRFERFAAEAAQAFAGMQHELVRIGDAVSMCDGYARGLDRANGDIVVFCHDDIEFLSTGAGVALAADLAEADVVVSVGGESLLGPTWFSAGPLGLQGWMAGPAPDGYSVGIAGVPDNRRSLATGDGCFMAMCREVAIQLGWQSTASTGFHLYDLDFCARARAADLRIAPLRRVAINHLSGGNYGDDWRRAAQHFLSVHGIDGFVLAGNPWVSATAGSRSEAARVLSNLAALVSPGWHVQLAERSRLLRASW